MATRSVEMTATFMAWDTAANSPKVADSGNFTLRWIKDGTASAPTNSVAEIDATNCPGIYALVITSTEADANLGCLAGKSSTADVSLIPTIIQFERLPNAAPGGNGGVPTVDASNHVAGSVTTDALVTTVDSVVDAVKAVTDNLPDSGELSSLATASALSTVDTVVDGLATTLTDVQGSGFDTATDSLEAVRNRGDSSWLTATGFNTVTPPTAAAITDAVWDEATSGHTASGTYGKAIGDGITNWLTATGFSTFDASSDSVTVGTNNDKTGYSITGTVSADIVSVSGDSTAAANLESDYDGTGYNKSASTIGTTTTNTDMRGTDSAMLAASAPSNFADLAITASTGKVTVGTNDDKTGYSITGTVSADIVSVSGDSTAAANLESDYDGTGYAKTNSTIGTTTTNSDMRGTDSAFLAASAPSNFADLAITASTGRVSVGTNNDKTGYSISGTLQTLDALNDFDPAADTVANVTTTGTVTTGVTVSTVSDGAIGADAVADIWSTTAVAESYASDGSTGTPAQLLYMIQQATTEFAISGTSLTVKRVDGSTTAGVWTLDDASAPTSRTRAS